MRGMWYALWMWERPAPDVTPVGEARGDRWGRRLSYRPQRTYCQELTGYASHKAVFLSSTSRNKVTSSCGISLLFTTTNNSIQWEANRAICWQLTPNMKQTNERVTRRVAGSRLPHPVCCVLGPWGKKQSNFWILTTDISMRTSDPAIIVRKTSQDSGAKNTLREYA